MTSAWPAEHSAAPAIQFRVEIAASGSEPVAGVSLMSMIRIVPAQRRYSDDERAVLAELFGPPTQWGRSLQALTWAQVPAHVPRFRERTDVEIRMPCSYDFEVAAAKYMSALEDGLIPLDFLFSGTVMYMDDGALRVTPISWESEAGFRLPVQVWRDAMDTHFPNSAWLRVRRDLFDRLYRYRAERGHLTWDATLESLLPCQTEI